SPIAGFSHDRHLLEQEFRISSRQFDIPHLMLSILADRRLHLGFVHRRCADWLAFFDEAHFAMRRKSSARRNQVTHDDVLLESAEAIYFPERSRFGKHARGVLE